MAKKYRLYLILLVSIMAISLASAVSISSPINVNVNSNFNLDISGSGFYALEMIIPSNFQIISDPSGGVRTGDLYKTVNTGSFTIQLRGIKTGLYSINGKYTDGNGIKDLNNLNIQVNPSTILKICPSCPGDLPWSNCVNNKQIKYYYICSPDTDYQCVQLSEVQSCESETCESLWVCSDPSHIAYKSSDCSLSSIQLCDYGCEEGKCKVLEELEDNKVIPEGKKVYSFFIKASNFFKRIINILIFWK
jgi:hypothetical protein